MSSGGGPDSPEIGSAQKMVPTPKYRKCLNMGPVILAERSHVPRRKPHRFKIGTRAGKGAASKTIYILFPLSLHIKLHVVHEPEI